MKFMEWYKEYNAIYKALYMPFEKELSGVGKIYDEWFLEDFANSIRTQCSFKGDKMQPTTAEIINGLGKQCVTASEIIIYPPVTNYMVEHFDDFYVDGIELAVLNAKMANKKIDGKLTDTDKAAIELLVSTEMAVWNSHIEKHRRQVVRELTGAMMAGLTLDSFLNRMVAPDGHVVAYPYGNSRISWGEHIRRFLAGRPRIIATSSQMRRMLVGGK